jgi:putative phage-type endonuclease
MKGGSMKGKIVSVQQNTSDWRVWRDKGLGASDAPIVMGDSPWTTRFQLWGQKTGLLPRQPFNAYQLKAMERGHELEPRARVLVEEGLSLNYPATSFEHKNYPFLRASLDGYNEATNSCLEIKCPGKKDHEEAVRGEVPGKYKSQVQMQLLVSGCDYSWYVSWAGPGTKLIVHKVLPDIDYHVSLLVHMKEFWKMITDKTPPAFTNGEQENLIMGIQNKLTELQKVVNLLTSLNNKLVEIK